MYVKVINRKTTNCDAGYHPAPYVNLKKIFPTWLGFYMNKQLRFIFLFLLVIQLGVRTSFAQAAFASEEELKQQALKLFDDDEFEEAYPLYSQLASLYPKDPNYNYRLGVCMLYASDDKEKPIPFLEFATKSPEVDKEVLFYLAKAYHLNYRFDDAIAKYVDYLKVASESKANKLQVDRQIQMCKNGKKLLRNITDLLVLDKKELSRTDFYRAYDISDIGGKLLAKPDEEAFKTSLDKKKKEKSIIYLATNNNQVFFSSYGDDLEHGKDIYIIRKLPNGEWSKPQTLGYPVNTEYDEDFPFLHPNGKVLYFCSKGHNSMGGYDIFKTTLNEETNTWNKPVNMDFPINTPDDDILYVTNEDEKEAFFSSARASKTGKTAVFHINVERKPIDVAIIKGAVVKNRDNQAVDVKITVKDLGDNTILGIYNAKAETGGYLINLPNGGKFMYTVEATGFSTQSDVVILPTQYEFKPLKQEISYEIGTDKLIIKNLFDEPVDDQSYLMALNFIKEKSKLDAGVDAANAQARAAKPDNQTEDNAAIAAKTSTENTKTNEAKSTEKTQPANLSNDAIVKIAYDDAKDAQQEAKDLQEQADIALNLANQKSELAQNKAKEAAQLMSDANSMTDNVKKQTVIDEANQASAEADELNQETVAAFNIAKKLGLKAAAKDEEADLSMQYAKDLEAAVKSKDPTAALAKLEEQEKKIEALSAKNGNAEPDNIFAGLKMDADNKKRELDKTLQVSSDIKQEIADNETLIGNLKTDIEKTKKDDLKKGLQDQIDGLMADNEQSRRDLEANEQKVAKLQKDFNGIKNEMELVSAVADKSKTESNENAAASVATIDKTKLEQHVNEIKTTTNDVAVAKTTDASKSSDNSKTNNDVAIKTDNSVKTSEATSTDSATKTSDIAATTSENKTSDKVEDNSSSDKSTEANTKSLADNSASDNAVAAKPDYKQQFADQLRIAETSGSELEKENKKAEIYNNWVAALNADVNDKKQALKAEKDKAKKKELNSAIASLEAELKDKQTEEKNTLAAVEIMKAAQTVADNSTKTADNATDNTSTASDNSKSDNTVAGDNSTTASSSVPSISKINENFSTQLADADKISATQEREKTKAEVLKNWAAAIEDNIAKQKQDLATSNDPEMKSLLEKKIADAEGLAKEKRSLADASQNKVNQLSGTAVASTTKAADNASTTEATKSTDNGTSANVKSTDSNAATNKTETIADNSSSAANPNAGVTETKTSDNSKTVENTKSTDIASADNTTKATETTPLDNTKSSTDASAENVVAELSASQKLDNALATAEKSGDELDKENKKKDAYTAYIVAKTDELTGKQAELKSTKDKGKKKELTAAIAALDADIKDKQQVLDVTAGKVNTLEEQRAAIADTKKATDAASKPAMQYTDASAAEQAQKAALAEKASTDLNQQAMDLKEQAAEKSTQAEKDALYVQANELINQADAKKLEAAKLLSNANRNEFEAGQNTLDQYAAASVNNKSDEIAMAEMMKDESKMYFDKAQLSRQKAAGYTSDYDKMAALEDAVKNDNIALTKQKKATEIYKKNNPGFVPSVAAKTVASETTNQGLASNGSNNTKKTTTETTSSTVAADNAVNPADNATKSVDNTAKTTDVAKTNSTSSKNETKTVEPVVTPVTETTSPGTTEKVGTDLATTNKAADNTASVAATEKATDNVKASDNTKVADANSTETAKSNTETAASTTTSVADNNKTSTEGTVATETKKVEKLDNAATTNLSATSTISLPATDKFERTKAPVYSASKPIPVNEKLPEGLIFKVQIGAFRNPIAPEAFAGMSPLTAETTPQGLTRYTAGLFTKFITADKVKEEIRGLGYKDAFVVAFLNGKRISMTEALAMSGEAGSANTVASTTQTPNANTTTSAENAVPATNNGNPTAVTTKTTTPVASTTSAEIAPTENVAVVSGLFYTVQVGVYSQPITSAKLYNIQPLYTEKTANGYLRYNTGVYNNLARAGEAQAIVVAAGVKDAFITAYYQGKRISLPEAANLEKQGTAVFTTAPNLNMLPTVGSASKASPANVKPQTETSTNATTSQPAKAVNPVVTNETIPAPATTENSSALKSAIEQNNSAPVVPGLVYKVQIGAFKDEVPLSIANQFLKIANKGIKNYKDANGLTIYTLGSFKSYDEASQLKAEIAATVADAFIVAYNDGKKISIDEAKTLQNK